MNLIKTGAQALFGGARKGNNSLVALGAALLAMGWVKRLYRPDRELLFSRNLRKGDAIRIKLLGRDDPVEGDLTIEG